MSFVELHPEIENAKFVALSGLKPSTAEPYINSNLNVVSCVDNDTAGTKFNNQILFSKMQDNLLSKTRTEIAKQYLDSNFTYGKYTDIIIEKFDDNVRLCLAYGLEKSGFEITYSWSDIAAAYEQIALNNMEWYYTSGRVLEVYNQTLEKDNAVGSGLDVQLDRAVFTDWVSDIIARQNGVKTAYESSDKVLFDSTVRREVDNYFCTYDIDLNGQCHKYYGVYLRQIRK